MPPLGTAAPDFRLPDSENRTVALDDFAALPALLVIFMSHHCPFTLHVLPSLLKITREYQTRGLAVVAINANDPAQHAEDSPAHMSRAITEMNFVFPYLIDDTQEVARAFQAACTPDFFLYDRDRRLAYRGRFDDSQPNSDIPVTGERLRAALDAVLAGNPAPAEQKPGVGCNIKWKPGNEPAYVRADRKQPA
jgi:peroxiredoxin